MKNFHLTIFLFLLSTFFHPSQAQDVMLNSQADIDSFDSSMTIISGNLTIESTNSSDPIVDLSNLENIEQVSGYFWIINNPMLNHLDGFGNLLFVGEELKIRDNSSILTINGFGQLPETGGFLSIYNNDALLDVNGFGNLQSLGLSLNIEYNLLLEHINGFSQLTSIGKHVRILYNDGLSNLNGLSNLITIGERFQIRNNPSLIDISSLSNVSYIGTHLQIWNNAALQMIDGFENLGYLGDYLKITNNTALKNINGFNNLDSIGGYLGITYNSTLENVNGFSSLLSISGNLTIQNNPSLTNCCGIQNLLNTLQGVGGSITLANNPSECSSTAEIMMANCSKQLFVDVSATGNNNGSSWSDAFTDLQEALVLSASSDTVHVAQGTYLPTSSTERSISFNIPDGVSLLGGYPSGGGTRIPNTYETILSGNIDPSSINGDSYHVITIKDANNVWLDGITIRDGNANDSGSFARARGGGIFIKNSTVSLYNIKLKWNRAIYGGGIFATLSPSIAIFYSEFKQNKADYGSAIYHSNETQMYISHTKIVDNSSWNRCAIEVNNSLYTSIENSLIANNASANANAIGFIATNRNQSAEITNCTILGESKNKNLITFQIGNNDQLDVNINNSIIAHQNSSFTKNMIAYNSGNFNLNHNYCYFQGNTAIGNGTGNLFSATVGNLLLNPDYSINECSPIVNKGSDMLAVGLEDIVGNNRFFGNVDIGAYEAQVPCANPMSKNDISEAELSIYPNPTNDKIHIISSLKPTRIIISDLLGKVIISSKMMEIQTEALQDGLYIISIWKNDKLIGVEKLMKISEHNRFP